VRSTYGNYKYFITFIDDFSRYTTVVMLKLKSEAYNAFIMFDAQLNNRTGRHVTTLRSDGKSNSKGTEYHSRQMTEYCIRYGIHQESSCAHTPEENSRAERPNRTIIEGANAMLQYARMPKCMWNFAVPAKVYLLNRSPHKSIETTPYQLWTGRLPDLANIRVFGTASLVHVPKANRLKLDAHATDAIFVGYSDTMKAWSFWDHRNGIIIISSSATFSNEIFAKEERDQINIVAGDNWIQGDMDTTSESDDGFMLSDTQPFTAPSNVIPTITKQRKVTFLTTN
jgi:hypothetical protein